MSAPQRGSAEVSPMYWKHNSLTFGFLPQGFGNGYRVSENWGPRLGWFVAEVE